jgi:hypothetical protein
MVRAQTARGSRMESAWSISATNAPRVPLWHASVIVWGSGEGLSSTTAVEYVKGQTARVVTVAEHPTGPKLSIAAIHAFTRRAHA